MFKHVISLGGYCGTAMELERLGLREASYPFDWVISEWYGVENIIKCNFNNFLNEDMLWQFSSMPGRYKNIESGISFFHDFNKYKPLCMQLDDVKNKYTRRIGRFYNDIEEQTLFIRYVMSQNELLYWKVNYFRVKEWLKTYNINNEILLIQSIDVQCGIENCYYVAPDDGENIARDYFLDKVPDLKNLLLSDLIYDKEKRFKNQEIFIQKQKRNNNFVNRIVHRFIQIKNKLFCRIYVHDKVLQE